MYRTLTRRVFTFRNLIPLILLILHICVSAGVTGVETPGFSPPNSIGTIHSSTDIRGTSHVPEITTPDTSRSSILTIRTVIPDILVRTVVSNITVTPTQTPNPTLTATIPVNTTTDPTVPHYVPGQVIVKYKTGGLSTKGATSQVATTANAEVGARVIADEAVLGVPGMQTVGLSGGKSVEDAIALYEKNPAVEYAQPDYVYNITDQPALKISVPLNTEAITYRERMQSAIQKVSSRPVSGSNPLTPVTGQQNLTVTASANVTESFGYMHFSPQEKHEIAAQSLKNLHLANMSVPIAQGSANLLPFLQYTPSQRNQGSCGNCWVWASTGAVEIAHAVNTGVKDRLSIQYFNSNFNGGTGSYWACDGGWDSTFANFYNTAPNKQMIPWSNTGADYADSSCSGCMATKRPASQITITPNYSVSSMSTSVISTTGVGQEQAIANIKAQLNQKNAVWWGFWLPNSTFWSTFSSFWSSQPETALWNPDPYNNIVYSSSGGGHAVLIVGYDDTSANPDEWYWVVLNSWGITSQRPNGLFRLKMKMDYSGVDADGYDNHYFSIINTSFSESGQTGQVSVSSSPAGAIVYLDNQQQSSVTATTLSGVTPGSHTIKLVKSGYSEYSQEVTVTSGQTTSISATMSAIGSVSITEPNDPYYSYLWGLHNTGQTGGTADADIDAPEAWAVSTGSSSVIVAVVDTGVDYTHPDLAANCVSGYDFINNDADPMDDNGHGTHCAGTIGAVGNNGIGVIGVAPGTKIMPLKFLSASGSGSTSNAIRAFAWGYANGARIFSNSWGGYGTDTALRDAINTYSDAVFICAAGNDGINIDSYTFSPAGLSCANIISVEATDSNDNLASWSNYGVTSVDLAAPGVSIYSTIPGGYGYKSGTSMATPHVSGVAALVKAVFPSYTVAQIRSAIMSGTDAKSSPNGKCVTGGRLNAYHPLGLEAKYYGVPDTQVFPLTVHFYDASVGNPTSWSWNFGDGNTSTEKNPVHQFSSVGTFPVTLTVQR